MTDSAATIGGCRRNSRTATDRGSAPWLRSVDPTQRHHEPPLLPKPGSCRFDIRGREAAAGSLGRAGLCSNSQPAASNRLCLSVGSRYDPALGLSVDQDPRSERQYVRGIDSDPQRALKWLPLVLVVLGLGFGIGALLGSAGTGVAIGVGLTGLFVAWREVLSERRQQGLDDRRAQERKQRQDQMPGDPSKLTPFERIGRPRPDRGMLLAEQRIEQEPTQRSQAKRLDPDDR